MKKVMIPIGEENFEKIRTRGFHYIDKTRLIQELVEDSFTVNLITRPRRFGKTLAMSMLKNFFDIRKDSRKLFEGLEITKHETICREWMNQYPVLFLSFKDIANSKYADACNQLAFNLSSLCIEHEYLKDSDKVDKVDKNCFERLMERTADRTEVDNSLFILTRMLYMHYGRPVILLIDEYDVPLAKASEYGYYEEMLDRIRTIMSVVFKTNDFLQFAVVTGCLRLAKESIFTGTNHFKINSIAGKRYLDCFGFTAAETDRILKDTGCSDKAAALQSWYDGYHFGIYDIYCPWDVLNYVSDLMKDPKIVPESYWKDTSHNDIIRKFVGREDMDISEQLEALLSGRSVCVEIREDTNYNFAQATEADLWSILYFTGYLTAVRTDDQIQESKDGRIFLTIPNKEIKTIFDDAIVERFKEDIELKKV